MTEEETVRALKEYRDGFTTDDGISVPPKSFEISDNVINTAITCCECLIELRLRGNVNS